MAGFRIIEHTADIGVEAQGRDLPEVFVNAARGMVQIITDLDSIEGRARREVQVAASDLDALMVAWLNELVYLFDAEGLIFHRFEVLEFSETGLRAAAWGEPMDPRRHEVKAAIKSTTYHGLRIARNRLGYAARVIFDI